MSYLNFLKKSVGEFCEITQDHLQQPWFKIPLDQLNQVTKGILQKGGLYELRMSPLLTCQITSIEQLKQIEETSIEVLSQMMTELNINESGFGENWF